MTLLAPVFAQASPLSASMLRRLNDFNLMSGVRGDTDLKVSPRGLGANMSVDVAAGIATIPATIGVHVVASDAVVNVTIAAAPVSGSRIDLIVATVRDSQATGSGTNSDWIIDKVTGVSSATPAVPATPNYSIVLAQVTVPSGTASITLARIADYRLGAFAPTMRWSTLPARGRAGQLMGLSSGTAWLHNGTSWSELAPLAAVDSGTALPADNTSGSTFTTWGAITKADPGRKAIVRADVSGYMTAASGTNTIGRLSMQISDDNGVTYTSGPNKLMYSPNTLSPVGLSDVWQIDTNGGGGQIVVRARIQSDSGSCTFAGGKIVMTVTPRA